LPWLVPVPGLATARRKLAHGEAALYRGGLVGPRTLCGTSRSGDGGYRPIDSDKFDSYEAAEAVAREHGGLMVAISSSRRKTPKPRRLAQSRTL
jgi:hypothetical protein